MVEQPLLNAASRRFDSFRAHYFKEIMIDPAKNLKDYRARNLKSPIWGTLDNFFVKLCIIVVLCGIVYLTKDFILEWISLLMGTIR